MRTLNGARSYGTEVDEGAEGVTSAGEGHWSKDRKVLAWLPAKPFQSFHAPSHPQHKLGMEDETL